MRLAAGAETMGDLGDPEPSAANRLGFRAAAAGFAGSRPIGGGRRRTTSCSKCRISTRLSAGIPARVWVESKGKPKLVPKAGGLLQFCPHGGRGGYAVQLAYCLDFGRCGDR